jgi:hypothetical protein
VEESKMPISDFDVQYFYNCFDPILETNAVLNDVVYYIDDIARTIDIIKLVFSNKNKEFPIYIKVICDDDTIEINHELAKNDICYRLFNPQISWNNITGKGLIWIWIMQNQQGYTDGIQLEFQEQKIIQVMAMGSCLYIRKIIEIQEINNECVLV